MLTTKAVVRSSYVDRGNFEEQLHALQDIPDNCCQYLNDPERALFFSPIQLGLPDQQIHVIRKNQDF